MFGAETRFLVVDDFLSMRKFLKKALNELGYNNIFEADDGNTAWKILTEAKKNGSPIEIIISDWNMPQMAGIELLKLVRKDEVYIKTPFIMATAEGEQKQILEAIKHGCSEYIIKPFAANVVKEKIVRVYTKLNPIVPAA